MVPAHAFQNVLIWKILGTLVRYCGKNGDDIWFKKSDRIEPIYQQLKTAVCNPDSNRFIKLHQFVAKTSHYFLRRACRNKLSMLFCTNHSIKMGK